MMCHRMEISVVVQKWRAMHDAPGSYQEVDRLPDGNAAPAQSTVVAGGLLGNRLPSHRHNFKAAQQYLDFARRLLAVDALQNLAEHEIAQSDLLCSETRPQLADLTRISSVEEIDPDGAIDDDQRLKAP